MLLVYTCAMQKSMIFCECKPSNYKGVQTFSPHAAFNRPQTISAAFAHQLLLLCKLINRYVRGFILWFLHLNETSCMIMGGRKQGMKAGFL